MATRSIVTSQPDVACDVCGRRLLRGEQPDVFLAGGERRMVCELCTTRAAHEGWLREGDAAAISPRPARPQRGRSLLGRLRPSREERREQPPPAEPASVETPSEAPRPAADAVWDEQLDSAASVPAEGVSIADAGGEGGHGELERAVEVFNGGKHPRRVAGVARSLGPPCVNVSTAAGSAGTSAIVIAWELCWYRYEVDLDDDAGEARLAAQGTELGELSEADRVANAVADERGELSLQIA